MNRSKLSVAGVGYNDVATPTATHEKLEIDGKTVYKRLWRCPMYIKWTAMLNRCYNPTARDYRKYGGVGVEVCEDWKTFSKFKAWMETQQWEGRELDKDLLGNGKLYSPETCCFLSARVNTFLLDGQKGKNGSGFLGVKLKKDTFRKKKFEVWCSNGTGRSVYLGHYTTGEEGYEVWRNFKHTLSCALAELETDERISTALRTRFKPNEEVT